jgi:predicted HNH restriction endonuclease
VRKSCEKCNYSKIEILQVHHKDKNRQNNSLENLKLLCPNCHAERHYLENSWLSGKIN